MDSTTDGYGNLLWKYPPKIPEDYRYRMVIFGYLRSFSINRRGKFNHFQLISNPCSGNADKTCIKICFHYVPYQLLHECPSKNYLFFELTEHLSIAKVRYMVICYPLVRNFWSKAVGNKTDTETIKDNSSLY